MIVARAIEKSKAGKIDLSNEYAAAVDLGATNLRVALGSRDGKFTAKKSESTDTVSGELGISRQITRMIKSIQKEKHLPGRDLCSIGMVQ